MIYQITSDNVEITPSMETLAKQKFERLENKMRDFPEDTKHARIVLNTAPEEKFLVKAQVKVGGREYFSDETDFSLESALIRTVEELFQMMEKEKTHTERGHKDKIETAIEELSEEQ
jgi:ribosome-associated translation inhibitor RaiA